MRKLTFVLFAIVLLGACQSVDQATPPIAPDLTPTQLMPTPRMPATPIPSATELPEPKPFAPFATLLATPTESPTATTVEDSGPTTPPQSNSSLSLAPIAGGFVKPTSLTHAFDERLFVTEQDGIISIIQDEARLETPFLDIRDRVGANGNEQGLLGLAFHPSFPNKGLFFVNYTDQQQQTVIARYEVSDDPNQADPTSEVLLLTIDQPYGNHNGGQIQFGPDGYLYVGMGDGGSAGDPLNNGQNPGTLLGALLRIDVDTGGESSSYAVPADNPFVDNADWRAEVWAIGLRNPWRFSFDRLTGDLYIADVGQNNYEEVNFSRAGESRGRNYGWSVMEATACYQQPNCSQQGLELPVAQYDHGQGCSITGGYVYRGVRFPTLAGNYFFADYCEGTIWSLIERSGQWQQTVVLESGLLVSAFGEDAQGELYVLDHASGTVSQVQP